MHRGKCGDGEPRRAGIPALGKAESAPGVCRAVTLSLALRKDSSCGPVASPQPAKPRLPSERAVAAIPHPVPECPFPGEIPDLPPAGRVLRAAVPLADCQAILSDSKCRSISYTVP